jgi:hypothetical protein
MRFPEEMRMALSWLGGQEQRFSPVGIFAPRTEKAAAELALMVAVLLSSGSSADEPLVARLVDLVEDIGSRPDIRYRPVRRSADVLLHALILAVLDRSGRPAQEHRTVIENAVTARILDSVDRLPHHMMEESLVFEWAGVDAGLPGRQAIAARSMLSRHLSAIAFDERATYHLTHDIMFLAGLDPATPVPADAVDHGNLGGLLADLLVSFAAAGHWDLVGELLLSWDCLGLPRDTLYLRSWNLFLGQQSVDGSFPGPPAPRGDSQDAQEGDADRFQHRYHTTLVAVLALHGRARRPAGDALPLPRRAFRAESGTDADRLTAAVRRDARWLEDLLDRRGASEPVVAFGVLVGVTLCAAVDRDARARLPEVARRVTEMVQNDQHFATGPAALTLTAHALLRGHDQDNPALDRHVTLIGSVLSAEPEKDPERDLLLCEKRVLAHRMGLTGPPTQLTADRTRSIIDRAELRPKSGALAVAVLAAESRTAYGTIASHDRSSAVVLQRHAIHHLRSDDLAAGCSTARAAHHLSPLESARTNEFVDWILLQQLPNGGYARRLGITEKLAGIDVDLRLRLPTTLACLWTIIELSTDFRLYRSIGAMRMQDASVREGEV